MIQIKSEDEVELINRSSSTFDLNESCFESVINWLYSKWIVINIENFKSMLEVSSHLKVESIKNSCFTFIERNLTAEKTHDLLKNCRDENFLQNFVVFNSFLSRHFLRIMNSEYFLEFPLEVVKYILSHP
uniref:BACK domain-containing protein n=1 Tax=Tetranychus urticae TaxID=32264 RepID=T1JZY2_TETUR